MASPLDWISTLAPVGANAILQRRGVGSATRRLTGGVDNATQTITRNGEDLQRLYDAERTRQGNAFKPWITAGNHNADMLNAGLEEGGGLADPYSKQFSFGQGDLGNDPGYEFSLAEGNKAIEAARRAMGTRLSGGAVKKAVEYNVNQGNTHFNDAFNRGLTTFNSNENTFRQNQADRYSRLKAAADQGYQATTADVNSGQNYANESGATKLVTGQQLADLQQQKAEALAAGDIGKANSISQAIEAGLAGVQGLKTIDALKGAGSALSNGAQLGSIAGPQNAATMAAAAGEFTGIGSGAAGTGVLGLGSTAIAPNAMGGTLGLGVPGATATGAAPGGGLGAAAHSLLLNPWTAVVGAGIIATIAILKSQAHWEANTFVKTVQNPFGQKLGQVVNGFDTALASGKLDKASAQQMRNETAQAIAQFDQALEQFATKGKDNKEVATNAKREMTKNFGANWERIIGKMDQEIAGLAA